MELMNKIMAMEYRIEEVAYLTSCIFVVETVNNFSNNYAKSRNLRYCKRNVNDN